MKSVFIVGRSARELHRPCTRPETLAYAQGYRVGSVVAGGPALAKFLWFLPPIGACGYHEPAIFALVSCGLQYRPAAAAESPSARMRCFAAQVGLTTKRHRALCCFYGTTAPVPASAGKSDLPCKARAARCAANLRPACRRPSLTVRHGFSPMRNGQAGQNTAMHLRTSSALPPQQSRQRSRSA
jgi:hypothetical protein